MEDSIVQQIKDRLDIVEVIGSYIKLQKTGVNYRALCPFHSEKKPSFFVSPTRQMFKCFGCGEGGSVFDFIMKIEGIEFGDALRILARRAGVELKPYRPELKTKRSRMYEICELACQFFEKQLAASSRGKQAKEYLVGRGLTQDSITKWRLGYAPATWQGLSDFLVGKGFRREEVVQAGLAVESEKSQMPYDRFRGRIIFPIFDLNSQVIGFGGRIFEKLTGEDSAVSGDETAKYINTPNTLLYDKSKVLYGLNFAKIDIRKKDCCILTEGYTDVILAHQAGFTNTIATSGTALTPYQLKVLKRYTSNLLTAFDMDTAGDLATMRGIDLAQKADFDVRVINMPKGSDPADILSQNPQKWENLVNRAKEIISFYFEKAFSKFDQETSQGKKAIAKFLLPKIGQIPNRILQSHWIQKLADSLRVSEQAVVEELKKLTKKEEAPELEEPVGLPERKPKTRKEILEEKIVSLILSCPENLKHFEKDYLEFFSPKMKIVLKHLKEKNPQNKKEMEKIIEKLQKTDQELKNLLEELSLRAEIEEEENPEQEIKLCLASLRDNTLQLTLTQISSEIKKAEEEKNEKKLRELIQKFNQIIKSLNQKNVKNKI